MFLFLFLFPILHYDITLAQFAQYYTTDQYEYLYLLPRNIVRYYLLNSKTVYSIITVTRKQCQNSRLSKTCDYRDTFEKGTWWYSTQYRTRYDMGHRTNQCTPGASSRVVSNERVVFNRAPAPHTTTHSIFHD